MTAYDLVLSGGTVIDPASGLHDRRDVGIAGGRIAAIEPHLSGSDAADVLDVAGLLVVPGLVDLHAHVYPGVADLSVEADPTCLGRGVTTVVDAGSSGANTFPGFRRWVVEPSRGRVLGIGRLVVGAEADVTVLALEEGRTQLVDSAGIAREATGAWSPSPRSGQAPASPSNPSPGALREGSRGAEADVAPGV